MDLQRVIVARLFRLPYNVQRARTGAFIALLGIVCLAFALPKGDVQYSLVGAAGVVIGGVLLWMSYSSRMQRRQKK